MGWSSGSGLFAELIDTLVKNVPEDSARKEIYTHMLDSFMALDWDDPEECKGVDDAFDEVLEELRPSEEEYEDEDED